MMMMMVMMMIIMMIMMIMVIMIMMIMIIMMICQVAMALWLVHQIPNHKIMDSSPAKTSWLIKKCPARAMGGDNGASVHSAINEYLAIDRDGNCTYSPK